MSCKRNADELREFVGRMIAAVHFEPSGHRNEGYVGLELDDGTMLVVMRDPEGNGPGHVEIARMSTTRRGP